MPGQGITLRCPPDSVKIGKICFDTYEASLWRIDPANVTLSPTLRSSNGRLTSVACCEARPPRIVAACDTRISIIAARKPRAGDPACRIC
jgi:hypothetical protein